MNRKRAAGLITTAKRKEEKKKRKRKKGWGEEEKKAGKGITCGPGIVPVNKCKLDLVSTECEKGTQC